MSTDPNKKGPAEIRLPLHEDVSFEPRDVKTSVIMKFLIGLAITVVISYIGTLGIYRGLTNYWNSTYATMPPSHEGEGASMPPEPRLQGMPGHLTDPQQDWRDMLAAAAAGNNQLEWVDQKNGIARIPVNDAMDMIVEKGLPALPVVAEEKKK